MNIALNGFRKAESDEPESYSVKIDGRWNIQKMEGISLRLHRAIPKYIHGQEVTYVYITFQ